MKTFTTWAVFVLCAVACVFSAAIEKPSRDLDAIDEKSRDKAAKTRSDGQRGWLFSDLKGLGDETGQDSSPDRGRFFPSRRSAPLPNDAANTNANAENGWLWNKRRPAPLPKASANAENGWLWKQRRSGIRSTPPPFSWPDFYDDASDQIIENDDQSVLSNLLDGMKKAGTFLKDMFKRDDLSLQQEYANLMNRISDAAEKQQP